MNNLDLYEKVRSVPKSAMKEIAGGRLKGMTDINPMWRIKTLTEQFGVCGFGWKTVIERAWIEQGADGERTANIELMLYIRQNGEWSEGIPGIGGSMLIAKERNGSYTDDESYKKAYTDALSVACKLLGIGADVYYEKDKTKYAVNNADNPADKPMQSPKGNPAPLTRKELTELGVTDFAAFGAWVKERYHKPVASLSETECDDVREYLTAKKEKRDRKLREEVKRDYEEIAADRGIPF